MWALRRASSHSLKTQGLNIAAFRACAGHGTFDSLVVDKSSGFQPHSFSLDRLISFYPCNCGVPIENRSLFGNRSLSSQACAKSDGQVEDDLEEGFSELEALEASELVHTRAKSDGQEEDDLEEGLSELEAPEASELVHTRGDCGSTSDSSDSDLASFDEDTLESELMKETEICQDAKSLKKAAGASALFKLVLREPTESISGALDKYAEGNEISRTEVYQTVLNLRRRKLYGKTLQLSEWLEQREDFDFSERDYASKVDLIAKVRGFMKAERYANNIPVDFRKEVVYRTLLANSVSARNVSKAEEIFKKMKDLGFEMTVFACNQLLLIYQRTDRKKVADVLLMMEEEGLKPSLFTYQILIDIKGQSGDITGMEQVLETMKAEGIKPDTRIQASLARHYTAANLIEKTEAILKEIEKNDLHANRFVCPVLFSLYAELGKAEDVERIWKLVESKPRRADIFGAIAAFGKLKNIEQAEAVFQKFTESNVKPTARQYTAMLKVYSENKMLSKGKEVLKQMGDNGCYIGPVAWDSLVKLYVESGEVEKADLLLQKVANQKPQRRPLVNTYLAILENYSKRGDVHNTEKTFQRMRQAGYVARARPFYALLQAYIKAKAPAYGMRERMKADNVLPNKAMTRLLSLVDAFRKTPVSDLLD